MKQRSLLFTCVLLFSLLIGGTSVWGQDQTVTPGSDLSNGSLTEIVNLELSGSWNSADIQKLMKALHPNGSVSSANTILQTVTYATGTEFTGTSLSLQNLFRSCTSLTAVNLPTYAGGAVNLSYAFYNCTSLSRINSETVGTFDLNSFPVGISNLSKAFQNCSNAVSIALPTYAGGAVDLSYAFYNCTSLSRINSETVGTFDLNSFPVGISNLSYAFQRCSNAVSITLPPYAGGAVNLSYAFNNCTSLSRINSETVGTFDLSAFSTGINNLSYTFFQCSNAISITLPPYAGGAIDLSRAFYYCSSLSRINSTTVGTFDLSGFPAGFKNLSYAFYQCSNAVSITLPAYAGGVIDLSGAFSYCSSLSRINSTTVGTFDLSGFPAGFSSLGQAFNYCHNAISIILPGYSATAVGLTGTFSDCYLLQTITGLKDYTNISSLWQTFSLCYSLLSVELGSVSASNLVSTFDAVNPNCLKYLPEGSEIPSNWSDYSNFIIGSQSAENIVLSDRSDSSLPGEKSFNPFHCFKEFTIAPGCSITYTRPAANLQYATTTGGWNTLVVPFDATLQVDGVSKTPVTTTQAGDYWLRAFISASVDGEATFSNTDDGLIRANLPYLLALPGSSYGMNSMEGKDAVFTSAVSTADAPVTVKSSNDVDYSMHENFSYQGVFTPLISSPAYLLTSGSDGNGDSFVLYTAGNVSSFRAYFAEVVTNGQPSGVRQLTIGDGGSITSLSPAFMKAEDDSQKPRKVLTSEGFRIIKGNLVYSLDGSLVRVLDTE